MNIMLGDDPLEQPSSVGQVSSPFISRSSSGHQLLEFCESNLLFPQETTSSNAGCCCYQVDSSYPLPTSKSPAADSTDQLVTTEDDTNNFSILFDEEVENITTTDDHISYDDIDYSVNLTNHNHNHLEFEQLLDLTLLEENQQMLPTTTTTDHCNMTMMNNNGPTDLPYPHPNDHVVPPVFGQTTIPQDHDDYLSSSCMPPSKLNNNHPCSSSSPNYCSFMDPCSYLSNNNPLLPPPPPPLCLLDDMQQGVENNTGRGIFNCLDTNLPQLLQAAVAHSSYDHGNAVNINNNKGGAGGTTPSSSEITSLEADTYTVTNKLTIEERKEKINRYMKKRNQRNFTKKIKYACRKTLADSRPRVRGRFAKNDEYGPADHNTTTTLLCCTNHEDDTDEDVKSNYQVVVKEEEEMMNYDQSSPSQSQDIFAHINNGLNSFKYNNNNNYPIQSWI